VTTSRVSTRRMPAALREALLVLAAGAGLGLAYGALTQKGIFQTPVMAPVEAHGGIPEGPMMVSIAEAESLYTSGEALFVDARSEFDYRLGHIKGALSLPLYAANKGTPLLPEVPAERLIVTYCDGQNCNSSIDLAARLYASGFVNVRIFFGGWEQWQEHHLPTESSAP
jgi:rhodanese-related sulfurtransferase